MAVRWGHGKIPGYLRPGWGMRGSLFAAFAVIAGMAIVISAGAGLVLRHLGDTMVDLSGQDIPRLAASLQLSTQAATLAAQGPAVLASQNDDALNQRIKKMKEIQEVTQEKLGEIIELGVDKQVISVLGETIKNIQEAAQSLISAARERVTLAAQHDKQYDALRSAQAAFVAAQVLRCWTPRPGSPPFSARPVSPPLTRSRQLKPSTSSAMWSRAAISPRPI